MTLPKDYADSIFERRLVEFFRRWAPQESHEAVEFHAALLTLVRQLYAEAQEPALRQLTDLVALAPVLPTTFKQEKP